jgi:hypothetical protein
MSNQLDQDQQRWEQNKTHTAVETLGSIPNDVYEKCKECRHVYVCLRGSGGSMPCFRLEKFEAKTQHAPVAQAAHICAGCTTPAILCPNANEPKEHLQTCASKNLKWPMKEGVLAAINGDPAKETGEMEKRADCPTCQKFMSWKCSGYYVALCTGYEKPPISQAGKDKPAPVKTMRQLIPQAEAWEEVFDVCESLGMDVTKTNQSGPEDVCDFIRELANKAKTPKGEDALTKRSHEEQAGAWEKVFALCKTLGMTLDKSCGLEDVIAFIRDLHRRAGEERYSVEEIMEWFESRIWIGVNTTGAFREFINDSRVGIKGVNSHEIRARSAGR